MRKQQIESYLLVGVQFLCMVFFFYFIGAAPLGLIPILCITVSVSIGLWAVLTMQIGNFSIEPIPKEEGRLVTKGPYSVIRHPMYAAVLLAMLGVAINIGSVLGYAVWLLLLTDLLVKMKFEEQLLREKFPEYDQYLKRTKRLLPWLW